MSNNHSGCDTEKNVIRGGCLYLVATPIGNLSDITERALKVLSEVDFIAAEDTRNSLRLLTHFGISKPLVSYFEHNKRERGSIIAERLIAGESCALITDAGTPAISDPGEDLVRLCAERNIPVFSVPGACAAICALTLSGLNTSRFCFEGFLPTTKSERRQRLEALKNEERTVIFHEAPHKLKATLYDLATAFGLERQIALCRELTKLNEQTLRTTLGGAMEYYETEQPRGEYVLVIAGAKTSEKKCFWESMTVEEHLEYYINTGMERRDAIKTVAHDRGVPKNDIYKKAIRD